MTVLVDEEWECVLRTNPEFASILGDKRYNDKLSDFSEKAVYADIEMQKAFPRRVQARRRRTMGESCGCTSLRDTW